MANATNQQIQAWMDIRYRPRCEAIRALYLQMKDDIAQKEDVYNALNSSPTWTDTNTSNPPHLLIPNDFFDINAFETAIVAAIEAQSSYTIVQKACVRGVEA